jgi:hypothetical protein
MAAIGHVFTISRIAKCSARMKTGCPNFPSTCSLKMAVCCLWVLGRGDEATTAFTDHGVDACERS